MITGANSGIGKAAAIQLARQGNRVIIVCRNPRKGEAALEDIKAAAKRDSVELMVADMSLKSSLQALTEIFSSRYNHLDVLIHNAAVFDITQKEAVYTPEGLESFWATNHIGPVFLTERLWGALRASNQGRIITVASKGLIAKPFLRIDLQDPESKHKAFNPETAYYQSKLAQLVFTHWLAQRGLDSAMTINAIRVPAVQTDISKYKKLPRVLKAAYALKSRLSLTPEVVAKAYAGLALDERYSETTGKYFDEKLQEVRPSRYSLQAETIRDVMALTKQYVDLMRLEGSRL